MVLQMNSYISAWDTLADLFVSAAQYPGFVAAEEWRVEAAVALALIQTANDNIQNRRAPPRFEAVHAELVMAANSYDEAVLLVTAAIGSLDASRLPIAQAYILEGNAAMQRALLLLEGLDLQTGAPQMLPTATATPIPEPSQPGKPTFTGGNNSQPFTCSGGCAVAPDPSCNIKGNADSSVYHTPSSRYYERTDVDPADGDRWFCTEEEARAAGYRPPEN
jgi:hypothetical protein